LVCRHKAERTGSEVLLGWGGYGSSPLSRAFHSLAVTLDAHEREDRCAAASSRGDCLVIDEVVKTGRVAAVLYESLSPIRLPKATHRFF
jgi:hypothetical protein